MTDEATRLARLEERVNALTSDLEDLSREVQDHDDRARARLHSLENFNAAAKAADAARAAVESARGRNRAERGQRIALALTGLNVALVLVSVVVTLTHGL